jgi:tetratricopeptide (TPR) repeat protein
MTMKVLGASLVALAIIASPCPSFSQERPEAWQRTLDALQRSGFRPAERSDELDEIWSASETPSSAIARSTALFDETARTMIENPSVEPEQGPSLDPYLTSNIAVVRADRLIEIQRLDEAMAILDTAQPELLAEPARYHFLKGSALFSLGKLAEARASMEQWRKLGPHSKRHAALADTIEKTMDQSDPESLEAIARDMRDVRRRLDLGEVGAKVRAIEDDVLHRLDVIIEKIENKQETSSPTSQPSQPNAPADESRLAGAQGAGSVDSKRLGDRHAWGNLPAKERQKMLQEIGRDLPGPYRSAVEEYFRRLAQQPRPGGTLP